MSVLINFKICDNAKDCNGIAVCKTGALSWDEENKSITIDNSKCISCGACEKACMVHAIRVAKSAKEFEAIKKEIANDNRKVSDLFVDRYGAQPVSPAFVTKESRFDLEVVESNKPAVAEVFNDGSIMCLLYSIPIKTIFEGKDIRFRKVQLESDNLTKKYNIKKLPALLFFRNMKLVGKIESYYGMRDKKALLAKVKKLI